MNKKIIYAMALICALVYPLIAPKYWIEGIGIEVMLLAILGMSLSFLASYGGMVSLSQITVAGVSGYAYAILSLNPPNWMIDVNLWYILIVSLLLGTVFSVFVGLLAIRTNGVYLLMLTLSIAVGFSAFAKQNYALMGGFDGYSQIAKPSMPLTILNEWTTLYYFVLAVLVLTLYSLTKISKTYFGLALQAIRDDSKKANSLGFNIQLHRLCSFALTGLVASMSGLLSVWYHGRISPASVGIGPAIDLLILCVLGGLYNLSGAIIGSIVFKILKVFSVNLIGPEHIGLITGGAFLFVMLFTPNGILGIMSSLRKYLSSTIRDKENITSI